MSTTFENIPKEWLNVIEPKVMRGAFLPCWIWTGALDKNGYPIIYLDRGKTIMAHRFVAKLFWRFPEDWYVSRSCGTQNCVNPNHLTPTKFNPRHSKKV